MLASPAILTEDLSSTNIITEYVVSADSFAGIGIECLLSEQGKTCVKLTSYIPLLITTVRQPHTCWRLIMEMPDDPLSLLDMVDGLAKLIRLCPRPPHILILCPVPGKWLMRTLIALACPESSLTHLTVLPRRTDCKSLAAILAGLPPASMEWGGSLVFQYPVLSPTEFQAIRDWLAGSSARSCASRAGGSVKTIYTNRYHARCKLGALFPSLLPHGRGPWAT